MNRSSNKQQNATAAAISQLKLIFSKLVLCILSIESDIKIGTIYLNSANTDSVLDVSANIQHKIDILKDFSASIEKICKCLNQQSADQSSLSHQK